MSTKTALWKNLENSCKLLALLEVCPVARRSTDGSESANRALGYPKDMLVNPLELISSYVGVSKPTSMDRGIHDERRKRARTMVHWPVLFFRDTAGEAIESITRNLSSGGFYCLSRVPFACGEPLICALKVPAHDPMGADRILALECRVRVLRCELTGADGFFGIACRIEDYRAIAEAHGCNA